MVDLIGDFFVVGYCSAKEYCYTWLTHITRYYIFEHFTDGLDAMSLSIDDVLDYAKYCLVDRSVHAKNPMCHDSNCKESYDAHEYIQLEIHRHDDGYYNRANDVNDSDVEQTDGMHAFSFLAKDVFVFAKHAIPYEKIITCT